MFIACLEAAAASGAGRPRGARTCAFLSAGLRWVVGCVVGWLLAGWWLAGKRDHRNSRVPAQPGSVPKSRGSSTCGECPRSKTLSTGASRPWCSLESCGPLGKIVPLKATGATGPLDETRRLSSLMCQLRGRATTTLSGATGIFHHASLHGKDHILTDVADIFCLIASCLFIFVNTPLADMGRERSTVRSRFGQVPQSRHGLYTEDLLLRCNDRFGPRRHKGLGVLLSAQFCGL